MEATILEWSTALGVPLPGIHMPRPQNTPQAILAVHRTDSYTGSRMRRVLHPVLTGWIDLGALQVESLPKRKHLFGVIFLLFDAAVGHARDAYFWMGVWQAVCSQPWGLPCQYRHLVSILRLPPGHTKWPI